MRVTQQYLSQILLLNQKYIVLIIGVGTDEYVDHISFSKIEQNFNSNTFNYENIIKNKCLSDEFFQDNSKMFDAIYIDGYHHGAQVYKDCINSWKFLKNDGLLICDDYTYGVSIVIFEIIPVMQLMFF